MSRDGHDVEEDQDHIWLISHPKAADEKQRRLAVVALVASTGRHEVHAFYESSGFDRDAKQAISVGHSEQAPPDTLL